MRSFFNIFKLIKRFRVHQRLLSSFYLIKGAAFFFLLFFSGTALATDLSYFTCLQKFEKALTAHAYRAKLHNYEENLAGSGYGAYLVHPQCGISVYIYDMLQTQPREEVSLMILQQDYAKLFSTADIQIYPFKGKRVYYLYSDSVISDKKDFVSILTNKSVYLKIRMTCSATMQQEQIINLSEKIYQDLTNQLYSCSL